MLALKHERQRLLKETTAAAKKRKKNQKMKVKKDGETKAYYPLELVGAQPSPPLDARFVAIAHMLQDEVSFNTAIARFREANGLTEENEVVPEGSDKE